MSHTIAIIGAGFSGAVAAARLLGETGAAPIRIVLINRSRAHSGLARGLAYGTQSNQHLLNVPAGRMSAFPEREHDFVHYLQQMGLPADGARFVPRRQYGEYLAHVLAQAQAKSVNGNTFESRTGEVCALTRRGRRWWLDFADRSGMEADQVVLALGNFAPANPPLGAAADFGSPRYVKDPWAQDALAQIDPTHPALLIGTGLTMYDVALSLSARYPDLRMVAVSRRGLLPQSHRVVSTPPAWRHAPEDILAGPATMRAYLRAVRAAVHRHAENKVDWRDVIASIRPLTPALWQRLPDQERARFLRHVRPYWDGHRHRAAPEIASAIEALRQRGQLTVRAGRLLGMKDEGGALVVRYRPRGASTELSMHAGSAVNCTGPTSDFRVAGEPLLLAMHAAGQIKPDALSLGIEVDTRLRVCDASGAPQSGLYCVGPLLKARDWEAVAVPELREHVRTAVREMVNAIATGREI